jgi:hypothetical protein
MIHWCPEETAALLAGMSALGGFGVWLRAKVAIWKAKRKPHCCDPQHQTRLSLRDITESFEKAKASDRVFRIKPYQPASNAPYPLDLEPLPPENP